jgi:phage tail-like protein
MMTQAFNWQLEVEGQERSETVPLPEGETRIGRHAHNDLVLSHQYVSGEHALLTCTPAECVLTDLGSTNGTSVDGEAVSPNLPVPLVPGTVVTIGPFTLTLVGLPAEPAEPEPPVEAEAEEEPPATGPAGESEPEPVPTMEAGQPPPPEAPPPVAGDGDDSVLRPEPAEPLPGLGTHGERLLGYLPGIYHTDFMGRFLAIFESILTPVEWTVDNFDLFLSPRTTPAAFLPWLANWYTVTFDGTWSEQQRRALLAAAPAIYARRGTRWALQRVLEIYTGQAPEIAEFEQEDEPFTFSVRFPFARHQVNVALLEEIIDAHKPAHTIYRLHFEGE